MEVFICATDMFKSAEFLKLVKACDGLSDIAKGSSLKIMLLRSLSMFAFLNNDKRMKGLKIKISNGK